MGVHIAKVEIECGCRQTMFTVVPPARKLPTDKPDVLNCANCGAILAVQVTEIKDLVKVERPGVTTIWH